MLYSLQSNNDTNCKGMFVELSSTILSKVLVCLMKENNLNLNIKYVSKECKYDATQNPFVQYQHGTT